MNLLEMAKADIEDITSDAEGFSSELTITTPDGNTSATIRGLHAKTHMGFDTDGARVNSKNARASFSEKFLLDVNYPVRNAAGEVSIKDHRLRAKDSTGFDKEYIIREGYPDETVGLIVCILGDFE
jgi:hypothetical protein